MNDPMQLPEDLPVPIDDGRADHLVGTLLPDVILQSVCGPFCVQQTRERVQLSSLRDHAGPVIFFAYPRSGLPGKPLPLGANGETWESIPGARGCTPQSCGFRDVYSKLAQHNSMIFGVSTNSAAHMTEFAARTQLPYPLLCDSNLQLTSALTLPTFHFPHPDDTQPTRLCRLAFAALHGRIHKVWYPVFPPDRNADVVVTWLNARPIITPVSTAADSQYVERNLLQHFHSTTITSRGNTFAADKLPAFIAKDPLTLAPLGALTYHISEQGCEVITLACDTTHLGAASELLAAADGAACNAHASRLFLTTTNDNLYAIGYYQRRGWRLAHLHRDEMTRARINHPSIPLIGKNRIPMRDELELELPLK